MPPAIIFTGRLQPVHSGHIAFWRILKRKYPHHQLVICILRQASLSNSGIKHTSPDQFHQLAAEVFDKARNPLPNWERLVLATLAARTDPLLQNAILLLRDRPDVSWPASLQDLPSNRVWAINVDSPLDAAKVAFYRGQGEAVDAFSLPRSLDSTTIRGRLRRGEPDLSFLPRECHEYFRQCCLPYIIDNGRLDQAPTTEDGS